MSAFRRRPKQPVRPPYPEGDSGARDRFDGWLPGLLLLTLFAIAFATGWFGEELLGLISLG